MRHPAKACALVRRLHNRDPANGISEFEDRAVVVKSGTPEWRASVKAGAIDMREVAQNLNSAAMTNAGSSIRTVKEKVRKGFGRRLSWEDQYLGFT